MTREIVSLFAPETNEAGLRCRGWFFTKRS
jgi:hypothetical protein